MYIILNHFGEEKEIKVPNLMQLPHKGELIRHDNTLFEVTSVLYDYEKMIVVCNVEIPGETAMAIKEIWDSQK